MADELTDWWTQPRLAYGRGLLDGYALGHDEAIATILDHVFGGHLIHDAARTIAATSPPRTSQATAPDQTRSWPTGHPDWPGLDHMTPRERKATYAKIISSWERP